MPDLTPLPTVAVIAQEGGYRAVEQLLALPPDELEEMWAIVPTERWAFYQDALQTQVRAAGAQDSDKDELRVVEDLLTRYDQQALVPCAGGYWTNVPPAIRQAVQSNAPLVHPE